MSRTLLQNAIKVITSNGVVYLKSTSVHDYVSYGKHDEPGYAATDGGREYIHRTVGPNQEDWDLYSDDPFDLVCLRLLWGTYGPKPTKERVLQGHRYLPVGELSLDHLRAIRATQPQIHNEEGKLVERVVDYWIGVKVALNEEQP